MASNKLLCKDRDGNVIPFEVDGDNWVDGSFEADVPFKRMSTLFSVSNFIVSQVCSLVTLKYSLTPLLHLGKFSCRPILAAQAPR